MGGWTEEELKALFAEYLRMRDHELAGEPYVKTDFNRRVQEATGRSKAAVEYKFCNASAVFESLGMQYVWGYKPRRNYQQLMTTVLQQMIGVGEVEEESQDGEELEEINLQCGEGSGDNAGRLTVGQLLEKAFGGGATATGATTQSGSWPTVEFAPGASAARDLLLDKVNLGSQDIHWLFLVGGPGNGKSELTASISELSDLSPDFDPTEKLHRRTYDYRHPSGSRLRVINDATIRSAGRTLPVDLTEALKENHNVIANVNRGILVEDRPLQPDPDDLVDVVMKLLVEDLADLDPRIDPRPPEPDLSSYLAQLSFRTEAEQRLYITIVRLDRCSLFEKHPETVRQGDQLTTSPYEVCRLDKRSGLTETTATKLIERVVECMDYTPAGPDELDPIGANLSTLKKPEMVRSLATICRSAEIASGRLFTFREIWGAIAQFILGPTPQSDSGLLKYQRLVANADDRAIGLQDRLDLMRLLSNFRFSQAMFGERAHQQFEEFEDSRTETPATSRLRYVDPSIDAIPGDARDLGSLSNGDGWASPVLDAIGVSLLVGGLPLQELGSVSPQFEEALTPFDYNLQRLVFEFCAPSSPQSGISDTARDEVLGWFGKYVLRLYAVSLGLPAFAQPILEWTKAWREAKEGNLPLELKRSLHSLIAPKYESGGILAMPAMAPRAFPLLTHPSEPALVRQLDTNELRIQPETSGDRIRLSLQVDLEKFAELDLNFALVREALAGNGGGPGATELFGVTSPRLERVRAALIAQSGSSVRWGVAYQGGLAEFTIG